MEIKINATLIIQVCNFLIAYSVLRRFLLKPVVRVIEQEKMEMHSLITTVDARRVIVAQKETEKKERWMGYQKEFSSMAPSFLLSEDRYVFKHISPDFSPEMLSDQMIKTMTANVTRSLMDRVVHDS